MKIKKEGKVFVAIDEETNISAKGRSREEAERKLEKAIDCHFDKLEFKPEFVKRIKQIEKRAKFVKLDIDEVFQKAAEEG